MDDDLQARIAAMRSSRRAGAQAIPEDKREVFLKEWIVQKHYGKIESMPSLGQKELASFDPTKLTVASADIHPEGSDEVVQRAFIYFAFRFPSECSDAFVNRNAPTAAQVLTVSTIDALKGIVSEHHSNPAFSMQCPGEIWMNGQKIAFVYELGTDSDPCSRPDWIILAVEVDLNSPVTSLMARLGNETAYDSAAFRDRLSSAFVDALWKLFVDGFSYFKESVNALEFHMKKKVEYCLIGSDYTTGTYLGVNDSGHVLIQSTASDAKVNAHPRSEVLIRQVVCDDD